MSMRTFSVLLVRPGASRNPPAAAGPVLALVPHLDVPGLVVDAGADDVHSFGVRFILRPASAASCPVDQQLDHLGDLPVPALHAVAQADGLHPAVLVAAQVFIAFGLA